MANALEMTITRENWPIRGQFRISRGAKTEAQVVVVRITCDGVSGWGECVPYARYGETLDSVCAELETAKSATSTEAMQQICAALPAGAARNALDCALWDWGAKQTGTRVAKRVSEGSPVPLETAFTLSLGSPDAMGAAAREAAHRPLLKIKLGGDDDIACMRAVAANAPDSRIIIDANEGWAEKDLELLMAEAARLNVVLIEQPLPAGKDDLLATISRPVPVCADESAHVSADLEGLVGKYDCVNIKLDKTGGLTEALIMRDKARNMGFSIMVGCMVGTSLAMAPAVLLAQGAEFVDLDGPLLLAEDRHPALTYDGSLVSPPQTQLWG